MPILDFGGAPAPKPRKKIRLILGIGTIVAGIGIGSTFAGNISLNGGGNAEFGQGVQTTAACDSAMTITPVSEFSNAESVSDLRYPMKSIKVDGVDLTPEGWDFSLPTPGFNENFNPGPPSERSWNPGSTQNAGKYKTSDGTWANTCEGKVLLLRAYTSDLEYEGFTVSGDINSPLWLNRAASGGGGMTPAPSNRNAGVGFRLYALPPVSPNVDLRWITDMFNDNVSGVDLTAFNALETGWEFGLNNDDSDNWGDSSFTIYLDETPNSLPALDSRWVNKITIESEDSRPSGWGEILDWFG